LQSVFTVGKDLMDIFDKLQGDEALFEMQNSASETIRDKVYKFITVFYECEEVPESEQAASGKFEI